MPEPFTLVLGGLAVYSLLRGMNAGQPAPVNTDGSGTGPNAPFATATGTINHDVAGTTIGTAMLPGGAPVDPVDIMNVALPADLVSKLDNETALKLRAYAVSNPSDFQAWLNGYADRMVLRNDLMIEMIRNPGAHEEEITLSPGMMVGLGSAAYKVLQAINGVAAGKSVDMFGISASVAGQIPGINEDFVSSLQAVAMGYRAISGMSDILSLAAANNVEIMNWTSLIGTSGAYEGLAALPLGGVLMAVGLVVDIGFTIIGDKPDMQKAVDVALDVASLAVLFIPVIGVVIAIVIQLVKFIIDLFGDSLFGGGMSHEQRELLELAKYSESLSPMFPQLANAYTPREMYRLLISWGSGKGTGESDSQRDIYDTANLCGGIHRIAMMVTFHIPPGERIMVGGQVKTVGPSGLAFTPGGVGCYWLVAAGLGAITADEQAFLIVKYGETATAEAIQGITESLKAQLNEPVQNLVRARTAPMRDFMFKYKMSLDQIDQIAAEYRVQPYLAELSACYGWPTWQEMFASTCIVEWGQFNRSIVNGTLSDFARMNGFRSMYDMRGSALATWTQYFDRIKAYEDSVTPNLTRDGSLAASAAFSSNFSWFPALYIDWLNQGYSQQGLPPVTMMGDTPYSLPPVYATPGTIAETVYQSSYDSSLQSYLQIQQAGAAQAAADAAAAAAAAAATVQQQQQAAAAAYAAAMAQAQAIAEAQAAQAAYQAAMMAQAQAEAAFTSGGA
jgi:hypothetical protein